MAVVFATFYLALCAQRPDDAAVVVCALLVVSALRRV